MPESPDEAPKRLQGRALVFVFLAAWAVVFGVLTVVSLYVLGWLGNG